MEQFYHHLKQPPPRPPPSPLLLIYVMDRQTDGRQTDRFAISISRVSVLTRDKNSSVSFAKSGRSCKFNREALKLNNKIK